jgi:hypothetical protein
MAAPLKSARCGRAASVRGPEEDGPLKSARFTLGGAEAGEAQGYQGYQEGAEAGVQGYC